MKSGARRAIAIVMLLALLLSACPAVIAEAAVQTRRIDLNTTSVTIGIGQSIKAVKPTAYPEGSAKDFKWESSDTSVATVNQKGKINGVKKGSATITISPVSAKAELSVTVVKKGKGVTAISLSKKSAAITKGKTLALKATLTPKKALE